MKNGVTTIVTAFENVCTDSIPPSPAPKRSRPNSLKRKGAFESDESNKRLTTGLSMYFSESLHLDSPHSPFDSLDNFNRRAEQVMEHLCFSVPTDASEFRSWMDAQLTFYLRDLHPTSSLFALAAIDHSKFMTLLNNFKAELWTFIINLLHSINVKCQGYTWDQMESDDEIIDQILLLFQSSVDIVELLGINMPNHFCNGLMPAAIFFSHYAVKSLNNIMSKSVVSDVRILQILQNFTELLENMHMLWAGNEVVSHELEANCTEFALGICEQIGSLKESDRKNSSRIYLLLCTVAKYIKTLTILGNVGNVDLQVVSKFIDYKDPYSV
jgi:hypothetical protein